MDKRIEGYDLTRSLAILVVFLAHILDKQSTNRVVLLIIHSLSPGLTMSLLGFISASLLSAREYEFGSFLIKRFTRIFISLICCLTVILSAHALLGKKVITQHTLLHLMGLSGFFDLFLVQNKATIGYGLWFITAITLMYLVFPLLQKLFRHPHGLIHMFVFIVLCTILNFVMYGTSSIWNVFISFAVGTYLGANDYIKRLVNNETSVFFTLSGCIGLLIVSALSTSNVLPLAIRGVLFAFYPLVFIPLIFSISKKLSPPILTASSFFAGLSYEFYILHFYFINDGFKDFFPASTQLYGQIIIGFITTFALAYILSKGAFWLRKRANEYLLPSSIKTHLSAP
jgi:surface polysaccharide O-acyltransferase-like enzyme